ncbi:hypothetical protein UY3_17342 [Chelonia mydas]|uniref:Uncharacterized protein n=1 Tax=Chelonia mydas TaxID=8469 RepID=M7AKA9_CHEMY|nr:hypothetical protein UY3_17342 [Chelonia mydas]
MPDADHHPEELPSLPLTSNPEEPMELEPSEDTTLTQYTGKWVSLELQSTAVTSRKRPGHNHRTNLMLQCGNSYSLPL